MSKANNDFHQVISGILDVCRSLKNTIPANNPPEPHAARLESMIQRAEKIEGSYPSIPSSELPGLVSLLKDCYKDLRAINTQRSIGRKDISLVFRQWRAREDGLERVDDKLEKCYTACAAFISIVPDPGVHQIQKSIEALQAQMKEFVSHLQTDHEGAEYMFGIPSVQQTGTTRMTLGRPGGFALETPESRHLFRNVQQLDNILSSMGNSYLTESEGDTPDDSANEANDSAGLAPPSPMIADREPAVQNDLSIDTHRITRRLRTAGKNIPTSWLGSELGKLAWKLGLLGQYSTALTIAAREVEIYRTLAQRHHQSQVFESKLAGSLLRLSTYLKEEGRTDDATTTIREAVDLCRELNKNGSQTDRSASILMRSLTQQSICLIDVDPSNTAPLWLAKEALEICQRLIQNHPVALLPDLTRCLIQYSACLRGVQRVNEASIAAEKAVEIGQGLVRDRGVAFTPDLAKALGHSSACFRDSKKFPEALQAARESVHVWRNAVKASPSMFTPGLAHSLADYSTQLKGEDAVSAIEEAIEIYRHLSQRQPIVNERHLIHSLSRLSDCLSELGHSADALKHMEEAAQLARKPAAGHTNTSLSELVRTLITLSTRLSEAGYNEEGLAIRDEAESIGRFLVTRDSEPPDAELLLQRFSMLLKGARCRDGVMKVVREIEIECLELVKKFPTSLGPDFVLLLPHFATRLIDAGYKPEALKLISAAEKISRMYFEHLPTTSRPPLAQSILYLSSCMSSQSPKKEGMRFIQEIRDEWRKRDKESPEISEPGFDLFMLYTSLLLADMGIQGDQLLREEEQFRLSCSWDHPAAPAPTSSQSGPPILPFNVLGKVDEDQIKLRAVQCSVEIHRKLAYDGHTMFEQGLALSLHILSVRLWNMNDYNQSLAMIVEATEIYRKLVCHAPTVYLPQLALSLVHLSNCLRIKGHIEDSLKRVEEAAVMYWKLRRSQPVFRPFFTLSMITLSLDLADLNRSEEADKIEQEASESFTATDTSNLILELIDTRLAALKKRIQQPVPVTRRILSH